MKGVLIVLVLRADSDLHGVGGIEQAFLQRLSKHAAVIEGAFDRLGVGVSVEMDQRNRTVHRDSVLATAGAKCSGPPPRLERMVLPAASRVSGASCWSTSTICWLLPGSKITSP